ncbi:MAG: hypothetical protein IMZ52_07660 [Actinobacteria bacterium]|nr:hypothetical protein [Actinomycetota bacterium]MBE3114597.1 hypothetical protein [Actinomycetota bacterium]
MLHGRGNQKFLTKEYEEDRQEALENRTKFTDAELTDLEITTDQGRGKTDYRKYQVWQWTGYSPKIRKKRKIDVRSRPQVGGKF